MANDCGNSYPISRLKEEPSDIVSIHDTQCASDSAKKRRAEYYREYRARKKAETNDASRDVPKKRKTAAEYQREYRARKKAKKLKQVEYDTNLLDSIKIEPCATPHPSMPAKPSTIANSSMSAGPSTSSLKMSNNVKKRKSPAERQRDYRARKKAKCRNISNISQTTTSTTIIPSPPIHPLTSDGSPSSGVTVPNEPPRRKSAAEYQREYRERVKSRRIKSFTPPRRRKSAAQYQREYRERVKSRRINSLSHCTSNRSTTCAKSSSTINKSMNDQTNGNKIENANGDEIQRNENIEDTRTATYNGFKYLLFLENLPSLNNITKRLTSSKIPFVEIRRLRHVNRQYGIFGQIINLPVDVDIMVKRLPRGIYDDFCINVPIKKGKILKCSYIQGMINKKAVRTWFNIRTKTSLDQDVTIDPRFPIEPAIDDAIPNNDVRKQIKIENNLGAQQQTLLWDKNIYLQFALGKNIIPKSLLFDNYAEDPSFPSKYLGQMRTFRKDTAVTTFQMATSEIRQTGRRGTTPRHLLYMAGKKMRPRFFGFNNSL